MLAQPAAEQKHPERQEGQQQQTDGGLAGPYRRLVHGDVVGGAPAHHDEHQRDRRGDAEHRAIGTPQRLLISVEVWLEDAALPTNDAVAEALGEQFRIGHSYLTPAGKKPVPDGRRWFTEVIETEIGPLLDEYFFDSPKTAETLRQQALAGW